MRRVIAAILPVLVILLVAWPARPAFALAANYPPGWNLVSGPEGARLVGSAGPLYTFQPGDSTYEVVQPGGSLHACVGYWAFFPGGGGLDAATVRASPCSINASSGEWAMAGNPSLTGRATLSGAGHATGIPGRRRPGGRRSAGGAGAGPLRRRNGRCRCGRMLRARRDSAAPPGRLHGRSRRRGDPCTLLRRP
jgi:hypothetical protein